MAWEVLASATLAQLHGAKGDGSIPSISLAHYLDKHQPTEYPRFRVSVNQGHSMDLGTLSGQSPPPYHLSLDYSKG